MRKLIVALSLISVTFAATTAYYAIELRSERARSNAETARRDADDLAAAVASAADIAPAPAPEVTPAAPAQTAPTAESKTTEKVGSPDAEDRRRRALAESSKRFLAQLADPSRRSQMLAERKRIVRSANPKIAELLGLTNEEYDRLIGMLAEQELDKEERWARCVLDTACDYRHVGNNLRAERAKEIENFLGTERQRRFNEYRESLIEREIVTQLRARLTDAAYLSSELSETLILALAEERGRFEAELRQSGASAAGFGMTDGWLYYSNEGGGAERLESATAYTRRMRDRAAQVLNADQLAVFEQMQESVLVNLRGQLEKVETASTRQ